jgi:hypothetical protein
MNAEKSGRQGIRVAAEFVLIVVGVLTALAVEEWRDRQAEDELREEYVAGLLGDIRDELGYLDFVAEMARTRVAAADRALLFLGRGSGPSDEAVGYEAPVGFEHDQLAEDIVQAGQLQFFVPEAVVWEDLVATGNLRLISDPETRRSVSRYYTQIRYQTRDLDRLYERVESLPDYLVSNGVSSVSALVLAPELASLSRLPNLPAYLWSVRATQHDVLERTLDLRGYAEEARAVLEAGAS